MGRHSLRRRCPYCRRGLFVGEQICSDCAKAQKQERASRKPEGWRELMVRYDGFGTPPDETT